MGSTQLQEKPVRIQRTLIFLFLGLTGCTTLPTPKFHKSDFPKEAYLEAVTRPYERLGVVRAKVNFPTLDPDRDEDALCRNYYNQSVQDLLKMAKKKGADAVIEVKSVVFYEGGDSKAYLTPECSDDGEEGQALTQGVAVKWLDTKKQ